MPIMQLKKLQERSTISEYDVEGSTAWMRVVAQTALPCTASFNAKSRGKRGKLVKTMEYSINMKVTSQRIGTANIKLLKLNASNSQTLDWQL